MVISCPECGASIYGDWTCHTWPTENNGKTIWMACQGCASATYYACDEDSCHWRYTYGLNPANPRWEENEKRRPDWIPEGWDSEEILPGVRTFWDD